MSKTASKTMIGAFVAGAITLLVIAVAIFGSGKFFKSKLVYETYFEGSVKGLNVGAPVIFRGVELGSVKEISLQFDPENLVFHIPVIIEIYPEQGKRLGPPPKVKGELLQPLIDRGLRAQLVSQSFITGQLAVALEFYPDKPARYVGWNKRYPEIPSVPTSAQEIQKTLQELPIKDIFVKMDSAIEGINNIVNAKSTQASIKSLEGMIREATAVMDNLNSRIGPLTENLQATSSGIRSAVANLDSAISGNKGLLETSTKTLERAEQTLLSVQHIAQENSAMGNDLGNALADMARSLRSLRSLTDYLERHPEAVIRGRR